MHTITKRPSAINIKDIIKKAKHHIKEGAVTDDYALNLKEVYKLLNEALATEIMCVLRYRHHQIIAKGIDCKEVAEEFKEHAESEERHMLMIAERITQLGGDPDFNPATVDKRTATEYGSSKNLLKLIEEDLIAERIVIMIYKKLIQYFGDKDPTTRRMLEQILGDEEEHANDLADLLEKN
jgi:bacterioferritin